MGLWGRGVRLGYLPAWPARSEVSLCVILLGVCNKRKSRDIVSQQILKALIDIGEWDDKVCFVGTLNSG